VVGDDPAMDNGGLGCKQDCLDNPFLRLGTPKWPSCHRALNPKRLPGGQADCGTPVEGMSAKDQI
jgi:hypothetical protein